jgi:uncharacterized protein YdbL (DUF1318 family)
VSSIRNPLVVCFASLLAIAAVAHGASKQELQSRFERRYPAILEYKSDGKVGENLDGLLEAVDRKFLSDDKLSKLIDDENADRKELYRIIADEEKTDPAKVASRMAQRNYDRARSGDYLKDRAGSWKKHS